MVKVTGSVLLSACRKPATARTSERPRLISDVERGRGRRPVRQFGWSSSKRVRCLLPLAASVMSHIAQIARLD
jgi:hypothetical protein